MYEEESYCFSFLEYQVWGLAEFVMMGILPDVARDLGISIATAGHLISAYALGVCIGAPMLILARRYQLKYILMFLVGVMMLGNICAALAPNYWVMLVAHSVQDYRTGLISGWHLLSPRS